MASTEDLRLTLRALMHEHRRETKEELLQRWCSLVAAKPELIAACASFFFGFAYNKLKAAMNGSVPKKREAKIVDPSWEQDVEAIQWTIIGNLLDFMTPLGKVLGDCTGAECAKLKGFYGRVAKIVPADEVVGNHLNNKELLTLFLNRKGDDDNKEGDSDTPPH